MTLLEQINLPEVVTTEDLGVTRPLARGATGSVEEITGNLFDVGQAVVLKRFHDDAVVDHDVLRALVSWRRDLPGADRARVDRCAAWPLATVTDAGVPVGHVMLRVPELMTQWVQLPSGHRRIVLREAQYVLLPPGRARRLSIPDPSHEVRIRLAASLAETLAFLHQRRIVVGDLSSRNVVCSSDTGEILLVDCDSMVLGGVGSPLQPTFTVDWDDPAQPSIAAASSDVYKLGLFVLRLLTRTFQSRDPSAVADALDATGRLLLTRSLSQDPAARPTAAAWAMWATAQRAARTSSSESTSREEPDQ